MWRSQQHIKRSTSNHLPVRKSFDFLKLSAINSHGTDDEPVTGLSQMSDVCDFSRGKWVPVEKPPLYTNDTCKYIHRSQDCMKNGRPDRGYLNWRWQPLSCELPPFDAQLFLQSLKQKKMAFIGDSIARNHMHSLLCALSQVEDPRNVYFDVKEKDATWEFVSYNFTLSNIWSPFLVNHTFENNIYHIHLDIPDVVWSSQLPSYDIAILSTGYWYFRPSIYYMNNTILGTNPHSGINLTIFDKLPAMRQAWETVLNYMVDNFNGITIMRTITVPHFESGSWSTGGSCNKTQPLFDPYMNESLPWMSDAMSKVQNQEFKRAVEHIHSHAIGPKRLRLLNITYSSFLRPDGHPNSFRIMTPHEPRSDCLHWCLPGPIDTWNEILMQIILG
ncbi:hypothetical protein KP509_25G017400 [Ceratopteris richardii]|uniref:Trichome birefringence-like N-terminal domain-containing protein n=1 Tax=Ceratopteris richardii TaxID=49495 RepID=A0A8T2RN87_CERRI|nr:hypothetical protein KP509_25G017400 [Ceratopteris richardii]